jgi:hypothetical protein
MAITFGCRHARQLKQKTRNIAKNRNAVGRQKGNQVQEQSKVKTTTKNRLQDNQESMKKKNEKEKS